MKHCPEIITILRMATTPPLARDRLVGLSGVSKSFVKSLECGHFPKNMSDAEITTGIERVVYVIRKLLDCGLMPWTGNDSNPGDDELTVAMSDIADRLCGTLSDPIIRNEQERRQLGVISDFLIKHGYMLVDAKDVKDCREMKAGTFAFHLNVPVKMKLIKSVNMPIDVVIKRKGNTSEMPLLVECKSAGDFTNTNKRRKEEAQKMEQLKNTYGKDIGFALFLCGYFDSGYLGYEAAEGIDWIWEHRVEDFVKLGV